jgi:catechol 2,3-dioxygenase
LTSWADDYNVKMHGGTAPREYGVAPPGYRLPDATHVGRIRLQVSDLSRSVAYYRDVLGFDVEQDASASTARLAVSGTTLPMIELHGERGTRPVPRGGVLGLYHFAILLPSRLALAQFVRHLAHRQLQFGAADHLVSEAIYLWDPDGLGIEVYADRPRDAWQTDGRELIMTTERLDLHCLVESAAEAPAWTGMPSGTTMGHMHLSVGDLEAASRFFHRALGLDTVVWTYPGALFLSAGGYHHHLGTNTWAMGARTATPSDARLLEWELVVPTAHDVEKASQSLRDAGYAGRDGVTVDPWGTPLRITAASSSSPSPATQTRDTRLGTRAPQRR